MLFSLNNVEVTHQRTTIVIFKEVLGIMVECYVDDLVIKLRQRIDHLEHLGIVFNQLRRHQLKMNPLKCVSRVISGKFLGLLVHHWEIEVDLAKIKATIELRQALRIFRNSKDYKAVLCISIGSSPICDVNPFPSS